ncbi:MAG: hypothetical protein J1F35_05535 [Erysipelotrichales bacterium]|nr:hypothetical protein [Erysipelotrichales bacterium]
MKKKMLFIIMTIFTLLVGVNNVNAATGSAGMDYSSCIAFADGFKIISNAQGSYEYKYCYRASCQGGTYTKANMTAINGFQCQNGNGTPYRQVTSDGCSKYTGTCNTVNQAYCTKVEYVDCNRNADGSKFTSATQGTTTQGVVVPPTTKTPTTVRPTTKVPANTTTKNPNTQKTTFPTIPIEQPTTKPTTAVVTNNTNIKKITVNDTDIKYKSTKDSYTIKLLYDIQDVDVKVELEDETSTVLVTGNTGMPNEDHEIKIVVTAVNGDKKEVTLKVKRYTNLSNDCTLANIYSEDYNIDFSKNTYSYKLKLKKSVSSIDFEVVPTEETSTFSIEGNEKLKNNSVIKIDVRAEDGTTCEYSIKIKKSSNTWKYILAIVLLVSVLVASSVLLYRYLKKSKGKYKYE